MQYWELWDYVLYYDVGGCCKTYMEPHVMTDVGCITCILCA